MGEFDALLARIVEIATDVAQERRAPYDGAKELWHLSTDMWELPEALLPFAGFASEWEDDPKHRAEYDRDMTLAKERIRRRYTRSDPAQGA